MSRFYFSGRVYLALLAVVLAGTNRARAENLDKTSASKFSDSITWDAQAAAHLLSRAGFGGTPEEAARLAALSLERAVEKLLEEAAQAPAPPRPDWVREPWINTERAYADTPVEVRRKNHGDTGRRYHTERNNLRCWWLKAMITTKASLREKMVLFWHGHFTTASSKVGISQAHYLQNETMRRHALGNFRRLLSAITLDPAMLMYLDMEDSDKAKPNENYARELFELFTLGIGNYTEKDVKETARALTGWTLDAPPGTPRKGQDYPGAPRAFTRDGLVPRFIKERHDDGLNKTILGKTGQFGVEEILNLAVQHPACGRFLAGKLIDFFGASDREGKLQERMAKAFVESQYDIQPMLKLLFTSPEFYGPAARGTQIKSPVHLLVGACRQLQLAVEPTPGLAQLLSAMGQELFNPPNVKGWPGGKAWITSGTLAVHYHLADALLEGRMPAGLEPLGRERFLVLSREPEKKRDLLARLAALDKERLTEWNQPGLKVKFDPQALFPLGIPTSPEELVDTLLNRLVLTTPRPEMRSALIEACRSVPVADRLALVIRLILTAPEYQLG